VRIAIFCHSLISDWNHGNAHFLRGVTTELTALGHRVDVYEPRNAWSVENLVAEAGESALDDFRRHYPHLNSIRYDPDWLDLEQALESVDLVLVHEWNEPSLIGRIGEVRRQSRGMVLLFHDTHHRAVSNPEAIARLDLRHYDGALLFGSSLAAVYRRYGLASRTWVWHEAADTRVFRPLPQIAPSIDIAWIGNWGDEERSAELREFLLAPVAMLGLRARIYGVRYPAGALNELRSAGIAYGGWLANFTVPEVLAAARATIHVPRLHYARELLGIPTIRVFEALACGIPLVCAPWEDSEHLFPSDCFAVVSNGVQMRGKLRELLNEPAQVREMTERGLGSILARHTCAHRAVELLDIYRELTSHSAAQVAD
jgi:spore maturation protein CgeB